MEDRGGFTASWCCSAAGQSHFPGMLQSDSRGADRGAKHTQASELHSKFNESRRFLSTIK